MGLFDSFPLSNAYSVNLDWIMRKIRELEKYVSDYTAVNNVAYAGVWDITKQYPQWAIVTDGDTSYLSNKPVPAGVPLENVEYWTKLADLDPRISGIIRELSYISPVIIPTDKFSGTEQEKFDLALSEARKRGGYVFRESNNSAPDGNALPIYYSAPGTEFRGVNNGGQITAASGSSDTPIGGTIVPELVVQKYVAHNTGDATAHHVPGVLTDVIIQGGKDHVNYGGGTTGLFSASGVSSKFGDKWDLIAPIIGLTGQARCDGYNPGVVTALWANAQSCKLTDGEFDSLKGADFTTIGEEINLWIRHKDAGYKNYIGEGSGTSVGLWLNNYQEGYTTPRNISFGFAISGVPCQGYGYDDNNVHHWHGVYTGILIDKIVKEGIRFGYYMGEDSYGIAFQQNYVGMATRPKAGIYMGDTVLNMGEYYGSSSAPGDVWRNGENLFYKAKAGGAARTIMCADTVDYISETERKINLYIGGEHLKISAEVVK